MRAKGADAGPADASPGPGASLVPAGPGPARAQGAGTSRRSLSGPTPQLGVPWTKPMIELSRTPVAVVCAGAKSLLDLPNTLEFLETLGVPVVGFGCDEFSAFYMTTSKLPVSARVDDAESAAKLMRAHWSFGGRGIVIAQPPPAHLAIVMVRATR